MRRLITLGCSFSSQIYPTWNEILGSYYDSHFNYGKGGAGNRYIFTVLMNLLVDNAITRDDTVVIQWSSTHRFDVYREGLWHCYGNLINRFDIPAEFGKTWYDEISGTIDSCTYAIAACRLLDDIGCKWYMACFHDIHQPMSWESNPIKVDEPILTRYRSELEKWQEHWALKPIYAYCFDSGLAFKSWEFDDGRIGLDPHPTPLMAYSWLRDCLMPLIGLDHTLVTERVAEWQRRHDTVTHMRDLKYVYSDLKHRWTDQAKYRDDCYLDRIKLNPS